MSIGMHRTELSLNKGDRRIVDEFRSNGLHMARKFSRAHILAALDSKVPERQIMQVLSVGRTAIGRTWTTQYGGSLTRLSGEKCKLPT